MKRETISVKPGHGASLSVPGGGRWGWAGQVRAPKAGATITVSGVDSTGGTALIGSKAVEAGASRIDDILPARSAGAQNLRITVESAQPQDVGVVLSWVES